MMTPRDRVRMIVREVAADFGVRPEQIVQQCRVRKVFRARVEVARRIAALSPYYSMKRIGRLLNHDHTTIVFYLGRGKKKPTPLRWRKPVIRQLGHWRCYARELPPPPEAPAPPKPPGRYLTPYAGADRGYVLQERTP